MGLMTHLHRYGSSWKVDLSQMLGGLGQRLMAQHSIDSKALASNCNISEMYAVPIEFATFFSFLGGK